MQKVIMKEVKNTKRQVTEDWLNAFPQLTAFAQNKLYKVVGPIIVGIELIKLPRTEEYRPHFVIYPLYGNKLGVSIKACLEYPVIIYEIYNKKGLQFSIPYIKHSLYFSEVLDCAKKQIGISFDNDISLKTLLDFINSRFNDTLIKVHSGKQAALYELKLSLALYVGDIKQAQNILEQIQVDSKNWNMQLVEVWIGNYTKWLQVLQEKVNHRDEFLAQITLNKQDKKIEKLKSSEVKA